VHDVQAVQEAQRLRDVCGDVQRVAQPAQPRLAARRQQEALRVDGVLRPHAHIPGVRHGVGLKQDKYTARCPAPVERVLACSLERRQLLRMESHTAHGMRFSLFARFVAAAVRAPRHSAAGCAHARTPPRACRQQPNVSVTVHTPPLSPAPHRRRAALQRARLRCGCRALMAASRGRPSRLRSQSPSSYSCAASVTGFRPPCCCLVLTPLLAVMDSAALLADRQGAGSVSWSAALAWHCNHSQSGTPALASQGRTRTTTALPQ